MRWVGKSYSPAMQEFSIRVSSMFQVLRRGLASHLSRDMYKGMILAVRIEWIEQTLWLRKEPAANPDAIHEGGS